MLVHKRSDADPWTPLLARRSHAPRAPVARRLTAMEPCCRELPARTSSERVPLSGLVGVLPVPGRDVDHLGFRCGSRSRFRSCFRPRPSVPYELSVANDEAKDRPD